MFSQPGFQRVLDNDMFRAALLLASQSVYEKAARTGFNMERMDARLQSTLFNYHNRMSWRPTPFGLFAGFAVCKWDDGTSPLILGNEKRLHLQPDLRLLREKTENLPSGHDDGTFFTNSSKYNCGEEIRFLRVQKDEGERKYVISSIDRDRHLEQLLNECRDGIGRDRLLKIICERFPGSCAAELADELAEEGLLLSSRLPNITGGSFADRWNLPGLEMLRKRHRISHDADNGALETVLEAVNCEKSSSHIRNPLYACYERSVTGGLNECLQKDILAALGLLRMLRPADAEMAVDRFRKSFSARFEEREVPLMYALDPEYGVGYENLEDISQSELLCDLDFGSAAATENIKWGKLQEFIADQIISAGKPAFVDLSEETFEAEQDSRQLSSGINILFSFADDRIVIEEAGGTGPNALTGRFTRFSSEVLAGCIRSAELEQAANPEVIFAEIACFNEEHAVNISSREHIRAYEIPVMVFSTLPVQQQITLDDLYLSVRNQELVIRSKRLNKRIIPRLSSAYNYHRSELPVFRFLCDLQSQGLAARFTLNPEEIIPGLKYYPRIIFRNCILSPARWRFDKRDLRLLKSVDDFLELANARGLSRYFARGAGDRQLVFDLHDPWGLSILLTQVMSSESEIFREVYPASILRDGDGRPYMAQFVATLVKTEKTYSGAGRCRLLGKHAERFAFPGSDWFYFKIYCPVSQSDRILKKAVLPFVRRNVFSGRIRRWFFVRYYDPEHHLRIRVNCRTEFVSTLAQAFADIAARTVRHLNRPVQMDTYIRELERYGDRTMLLTEDVFWQSSEICLQYISKDTPERERILSAIRDADLVFDGYMLSAAQRIELLEGLCKSLMNELGEINVLRPQLNMKFRKYQREISGQLTNKSKIGQPHTQFVCALGKLVSGLRRTGHSTMLRSAADILHMHMNRMFAANQRKSELVIYYLCLRYYISMAARQHSGITRRTD